MLPARQVYVQVWIGQMSGCACVYVFVKVCILQMSECYLRDRCVRRCASCRVRCGRRASHRSRLYYCSGVGQRLLSHTHMTHSPSLDMEGTDLKHAHTQNDEKHLKIILVRYNCLYVCICVCV